MFETSFALTRSSDMATIGIVDVAACAASPVASPKVAITAGRGATRSAASAGKPLHLSLRELEIELDVASVDIPERIQVGDDPRAEGLA